MLCHILDTHYVLNSGRRRITTHCNAISLSIASAMRFRSLQDTLLISLAVFLRGMGFPMIQCYEAREAQ